MLQEDARTIALHECQNAVVTLHELEQADIEIAAAFAVLRATLRKYTDNLPISDADKRWVDPDLNGLGDVESDVKSTLGTLREDANEGARH